MLNRNLGFAHGQQADLWYSLPNGSTRMFACGVELPSPSRTENTIVATVEMYLISNARLKPYRYLTWE